MQITVKVRVNKEKLEQLLHDLKPRADSILDKSAFDIQMTAQGLALVDTGAMRASIYVSGPSSGSNFGIASDTAIKLAARGGRSITMGNPPPVEELQRAIGCGVNYGIFVELKYKPFMAPAAEAHRDSFIAAWNALV